MSDRDDILNLKWLVYGQIVTQGICALVELGIPDLLADGPRSVVELANASGADHGAVRRLLRGLCVFEVFRECSGDRFELARLGTLLCQGVPGSVRSTALLAAREMGVAWSGLTDVVRTGRSAFTSAFGVDFFAYLQQNPDRHAEFDRSQAASTHIESAELLTTVDFGRYGTVADIGGGNGTLLCRILSEHPDTNGMLLELPTLLTRASAVLAQYGLADRCTLIGGDFFDQVPEGADLYLLAHVLHNWDDKHAVLLLERCRQAMAPEATLIVYDMVADGDSSAARSVAVMDLYMLTLFGSGGGRERNDAEFRALFDEAQFNLVSIEKLPSGHGVLQARPRSHRHG